jgi:hypothetical protein
MSNVGPSAKRFGQDMLQMVTDPVGTAKTLGKVGVGAAQKVIPGEQEYEPYADAVGQFFADRYGGLDNVKRTLAEDPVGFAADLSTVLTGGQMALLRAPGIAGQVGRAAGTVSRAVDPINATLKGAQAVGKGIGHTGAAIMGVATGTGGRPIREAARSGAQGGAASTAFRENMRGNVPLEDVIGDAKTALSAIKAERSAAYTAGMGDVAKDAKVLNFTKVEDALNKTRADTTFKGVSVSPSTDATISDIAKVMDEWKQLDPAEYHTAAGFDALKKRIGDIRESAQYGTPQRRVADQIYNVVKDQITKQAPTYAKTMKDYSTASNLIREMEKTLSLNPKASVDTTLRKLQSVMRDNVNTNYGKRADLVKLLEEHGATNLMQKLAGQALKSWEPRGLARLGAQAGAVLTGGAGLMTMNPLALPAVAGQLAMQSPRIVGEVAHAGGRVANALSNVPARNALQAGYQTRGARQ